MQVQLRQLGSVEGMRRSVRQRGVGGYTQRRQPWVSVLSVAARASAVMAMQAGYGLMERGVSIKTRDGMSFGRSSKWWPGAARDGKGRKDRPGEARRGTKAAERQASEARQKESG